MQKVASSLSFFVPMCVLTSRYRRRVLVPSPIVAVYLIAGPAEHPCGKLILHSPEMDGST